MDLNQNFLETEQNWKLSEYTAYSALFHGTFVSIMCVFPENYKNCISCCKSRSSKCASHCSSAPPISEQPGGQQFSYSSSHPVLASQRWPSPGLLSYSVVCFPPPCSPLLSKADASTFPTSHTYTFKSFPQVLHLFCLKSKQANKQTKSYERGKRPKRGLFRDDEIQKAWRKGRDIATIKMKIFWRSQDTI